MNSNGLYEKVKKVIDSCKTHQHITSAGNYVSFAMKRLDLTTSGKISERYVIKSRQIREGIE